MDNFRFFNLLVYPMTDSEGAVAEVKAEGIIKSTGRVYRQDYVVFLRAAGGKKDIQMPPNRLTSRCSEPLAGRDDQLRTRLRSATAQRRRRSNFRCAAFRSFVVRRAKRSQQCS